MHLRPGGREREFLSSANQSRQIHPGPPHAFPVLSVCFCGCAAGFPTCPAWLVILNLQGAATRKPLPSPNLLLLLMLSMAGTSKATGGKPFRRRNGNSPSREVSPCPAATVPSIRLGVFLTPMIPKVAVPQRLLPCAPISWADPGPAAQLEGAGSVHTPRSPGRFTASGRENTAGLGAHGGESAGLAVQNLCLEFSTQQISEGNHGKTHRHRLRQHFTERLFRASLDWAVQPWFHSTEAM